MDTQQPSAQIATASASETAVRRIATIPNGYTQMTINRMYPSQTGIRASLPLQSWPSAVGLLDRALMFQYTLSKTQQARINIPVGMPASYHRRLRQVLQPVHILREFRHSRRASNVDMRHRVCFPLVLAFISVLSAGVVQGQRLRSNSILDSLQSITASTTPPNGDLNPYGVAFVPAGFPAGGNIAAGDVLVSDFNNSSNLQGTGTTIVSITPQGQQSVFATSTLIGVDTALGVLSSGFVIVGNFPVSYPGGVATFCAGIAADFQQQRRPGHDDQ
jgi:hypothetical protein